MSYSIKVGLLGDPAVGKTSLGKRYVDNKFTQEYKSTIGTEIYVKEFLIDQMTCKCVIWDLSGAEAFAKLRLRYLKGMDGGLVIFDKTRVISIEENILPWAFELIEMQIRKNIPLAILGNKGDIASIEKINENEMIKKLKDLFGYNTIKYFTTSALTGENVQEAFEWLVDEATNNYMNKTRISSSTLNELEED